jgi:hypothetical protein
MYNLLSYKNLFKVKQISKTISNESLLTVAVKDGRVEGGYKPSLITVDDFKAAIGGGAIAGTYAELKALVDSNSLVEGGHYLLTDFRTRARLFDNTIPTYTFIEGAIEPLILTAASTNEFTGMALSTIYPEDEIVYQFDNIDVLAYIIDNFFPTDPGKAEDIINNENIVAYGADRGFITYRKDPRNRLSTNYDWREYKFKRFEHPTNTGVYSEWENNGGTEKQLLTFFNFKDPYLAVLANPDYQINDNTIGAVYRFGLLLANDVVLYADVDAPNYLQCFDNIINSGNRFSLCGKTMYQNYIDCDSFENNKLVPLTPGDANFYGNMIQGRTFRNNIFGQQVSNNLITGSNVTENTFGSPASQPTSSCNFSENIIHKAAFSNNVFNAQNMSGNDIIGGEITECTVEGPRFRNNEISGVIYLLNLTGFVTAGFERNTIEAQASMTSVTIDCPSTTGNFQYNRIQCRTLNLVNFGSSTTQHVRKFTYNKTLTTQIDGNNVLTYLDATGALTAVAITA